MQTGIVQPSGPSNHFWINFGSVCARYTASGGAAKRLVTTTCVSPSVFSVILLIAFPLFCASPSWPEPRPAGRSFSRALFAAFEAIGPSLQYRPLRDDEGASCPRLDEQRVPHLRAPCDVGRLPVASSQTAPPAPSLWPRPWRDARESPDASGRPRRRRRHPDSTFLNPRLYSK